MDQPTRVLDDGGRQSDLVRGYPGHFAHEGTFA